MPQLMLRGNVVHMFCLLNPFFFFFVRSKFEIKVGLFLRLLLRGKVVHMFSLLNHFSSARTCFLFLWPT